MHLTKRTKKILFGTAFIVIVIAAGSHLLKRQHPKIDPSHKSVEQLMQHRAKLAEQKLHTPLGEALSTKKFAEFDQGDDDRRGFVIDVSSEQAKCDWQRIKERRRGAHHNEHIHVRGFVAKRLIGANVILPAHVKLNGQSERKH